MNCRQNKDTTTNKKDNEVIPKRNSPEKIRKNVSYSKNVNEKPNIPCRNKSLEKLIIKEQIINKKIEKIEKSNTPSNINDKKFNCDEYRIQNSYYINQIRKQDEKRRSRKSRLRNNNLARPPSREAKSKSQEKLPNENTSTELKTTIKKDTSNYQVNNRLNSENTEDKNPLKFLRKSSENRFKNFGTAAFYYDNENETYELQDFDNERQNFDM